MYECGLSRNAYLPGRKYIGIRFLRAWTILENFHMNERLFANCKILSPRSVKFNNIVIRKGEVKNRACDVFYSMTDEILFF